jgi:hypothetical protein
LSWDPDRDQYVADITTAAHFDFPSWLLDRTERAHRVLRRVKALSDGDGV